MNITSIDHPDAHLIAAAPDLYKMLASVAQRYSELQSREATNHEFECCIDSIQEVLAKARGEA